MYSSLRFEPSTILRHDFDRIFRDFTTGFPFATQYVDSRRSVVPPTNVWESNDTVFFEMELPGLTIEEVDLGLVGKSFTIKAEQRQSEKQEGETVKRERSLYRFSRSFELPYEVDADAVSATLKNGVLTVSLPKAASALPKKIKVTVGK